MAKTTIRYAIEFFDGSWLRHGEIFASWDAAEAYAAASLCEYPQQRIVHVY